MISNSELANLAEIAEFSVTENRDGTFCARDTDGVDITQNLELFAEHLLSRVPRMKLWSENIGGNLHEATTCLNSAGISDIVTMDSDGRYTIVVFRIAQEEYDRRIEARRKRNEELNQQLNEGLGFPMGRHK